MTTVETAKLIRQALATDYPELKASVRKVHTGVIYVFHNSGDLAYNTKLGQYLRQFEDWFEFGTEYVFQQQGVA